MNRPNLLYIAPTIPRPSGNGLAMRAYHVLHTLSSEYAVHLLVVDHRLRGTEQTDFLMDLCRRVDCVPALGNHDPSLLLRRMVQRISPRAFCGLYSRPLEWVHITNQRIARAFFMVSDVRFDTIHAFRLYTVPFLRPFRKRPFFGTCQVDLDDIESVTRRRLGDLYARNGDEKKASFLYREARLYGDLERKILPLFDRIFVCSEDDAVSLGGGYECRRPDIVPNVIQIPVVSHPEPAGDAFTFLFVGTLRYYPNQEGVVYFCREVLPHIREAATRRFTVKVVGTGLSDNLSRYLSSIPCVEVIGYVPDLGRVYGNAHACIVPVRGGGGTRIKVLEAFAQKRPVVSTSAGIQGIRATPGKHFLTGDTAFDFAMQCRRLMEDPDLCRRLSESAFDLVKRYYTLDALRGPLLARSR